MRDEYLGRAEYDRAHEAEDEEELEGRSRCGRFLAERGCNDEDIDELFSMLDREPEAEDNVEEEDDLQRNGREGSMGGRVSEYDREAGDRKRMARDRRRQMASDAADERAEQSFDQMFPDARRAYGSAVSKCSRLTASISTVISDCMFRRGAKCGGRRPLPGPRNTRLRKAGA